MGVAVLGAVYAAQDSAAAGFGEAMGIGAVVMFAGAALARSIRA
ncbi:MAG: hypothetical protein ACYCYN_05575 [Solirubrobacteraceae bacterium]